MSRIRRGIVALLCPVVLVAGDPGCPRYPSALRTEMAESLELDRAYETHRRSVQRNSAAGRRAAEARSNFIDQRLFAKMAADNVAPAAPATDAEFLRRVTLDLTGRIPTPEAAEAFLADTDAGKRAKLIDSLLDSDAYSDQLTLFFLNRFRVSRNHESISVPARNTFYEFVRSFVQTDRPYDQFVRDLLSAGGEVDTQPGTQFFARWMDVNGPIQDSWDDITDKITTTFLGFKTECVSCHNGRAHLEKINVWLSRRTRQQFWQTSAFLSRMYYIRWSDDVIGFRPRIVLIDRDYGSYSGSVNPTNPGNRPARTNAVVNPEFVLNQARPTTEYWRQDLGRIITADKQFARATVNHLWANFFGHGIVDPPEGWDFTRTDGKTAPPEGFPSQNSQPELLEDLADFFIRNNYQLKPLIRQIVSSDAYQLSSRYEGQWQPAYIRYFAKFEARRLSAEQLYDALVTATRTEQPMTVAGLARALQYANQLPDAAEPSTDGRVIDFLNQAGRGNWTTIDRSEEPTILGLLFSMNEAQVVQRSMGTTSAAISSRNQVLRIDAMPISDEEAIRKMYIATLTRWPSDDELAAVLRYRSGPRAQWLSDLQWALLNKLDFTFNY
ncbi:MAG: DUF1549 domain-containing protein [Acidobacteria bacterium]|nr:DUF1549 domain-containing protein [Acidobacteriota bacterium]